ncbi:type VI secretion system contractile sheath domain-containing protein [Neptunicoccus sediminis]|uniref:type VI secretion system contractile sheath domain-containing protein n=1 Tax=Neptunicoccus sediminis TaxID=1892596 RepID=UPI00316AE931
MKSAATAPAATEDRTDAVLAELAATQPEEEEADTAAAVLASMAASAPEDVEETDTTANVLAGMAAAAPAENTADNSAAELLAQMAASAPEPQAQTDDVTGILSQVAENTPDEPEDGSTTDALLDSLSAEAPEEDGEDTSVDDLLSDMAEELPEEEEAGEDIESLLADVADTASDEPEDDSTYALLDSLSAGEPEEVEADTSVDDLLSDMAEELPEEGEAGEDIESLLADVADAASDEPEDDSTDALLDSLSAEAPEEDGEDTSVDDLLSDMAEELPEEEEAGEDIESLLADVADAASDEPEDDSTDALLSEVAEDAPKEGAEDEDLDEFLSDVTQNTDFAEESGEDDTATDLDALFAEDENDTDLDDLLAESEESDTELDALQADDADPSEASEEDDLDALLAEDREDTDLDDLCVEGEDADTELDDLLADDADPGEASDEDDDLNALFAEDGEDTDLDDLLAEDDDSDAELDDLLADDADLDEASEEDDLDALLAEDEGADTDLEDLLGESDADDLDAMLADFDDDDAETSDASETGEEASDMEAEATAAKAPYNPAFGKMTAPKPEIKPGDRRKMRIAILGDFSGRANKGAIEGGADLASRKAIKFDIDTVEDVIARFATTLTLPLGRDGSAIEVELGEIDDLHPDELYDNVELFGELSALRTQVKRGTNLDNLTATLQEWGGAFGDFKLARKGRARGAAANASLQVSEFAALIGAEAAPKPEATAIEDMIQRIVAPFIVAAPDSGQDSLLAAVDQALGAAMSSILHHPDFQAVEANWRTLDMLARRIETGSHLELVLYDVAVEEFAADLAAHEDLGESALYDMLVERPRLNEDQGPLAAVLGLYTFEETPPHAELLARMSKISAQMDAPFIAAMGAGYLQTKAEDLHPLIAKTWAALRETPEAKYIALATPRFLLRMPYGKKTDPVEPFAYEEFNTREGMRSLLMGNPATLVAILLAQTLAQQGAEMSLGSIMTLDDMPFHYMLDQYGDQVALPSTERLINVRMASETVQRGYLPVLSIQGQNVVRLGSFNGLGGGELLGLWSGEEAKLLQSGKIQSRTGVALGGGAAKSAPPVAVGAEEEGESDTSEDDGFDLGGDDDDFDLGGGDDDDFDLGFDLDGEDEDSDDGGDLDLDLGNDGDLDDLLSGFDDDDNDDSAGDDEDMDEDLAALLADL